MPNAHQAFPQLAIIRIVSLLFAFGLTFPVSRPLAQDPGLASAVEQKLEAKINAVKLACPSDRASQAQQSLIACAEKAPCDQKDCPQTQDPWGDLIGCIEQCAIRAVENCGGILDLALRQCEAAAVPPSTPTDTPRADLKSISVRPIRHINIFLSNVVSIKGSDADPDVYRQSPGGQWEKVDPTKIHQLEPGQRLSTGDNGKVTLEYVEYLNGEPSSEVITVDANTIIFIEESVDEPNLFLENGQIQIQSDSSKRKDATFELSTPTANVRLEGTAVTVKVVKDTSTEVTVKDGRVKVSNRNKDKSVALKAGQTIIVTAQTIGEPTVRTDNSKAALPQSVYQGLGIAGIAILVFFLAKKFLKKH